LGLPDWTVTFLIILIIAGFPITIILSWIFDVTPEGIVKTETFEEAPEQEQTPSPTKRGLKASDAIIAVLFIAVMPFQNMTNDTLLDIWQAGIQNEIITSLSNSKELSVRQFETTLDILQGTDIPSYAALTPSIAGDLSRRLNASTFINGTIKAAGNRIRINTQLIDSHTEEIYKTYQVDGYSESDILLLMDSLSSMIKNFLQIRILEKDVKPDLQNINEKSAAAYRHYILGMESDYANDRKSAIEYFKKAIEEDQKFALAYVALIRSCYNFGLHGEAKEWLGKAMDYYNNLPTLLQFKLDDWDATYAKDMQEVIRIKNQIVELEPESRRAWHGLGWAYDQLNQYENAIVAYERAIEIDRQWGGGWQWVNPYWQLGQDYHKLGNHKRENEIYRMALLALPNSTDIIYYQTICALSQGDTVLGNRNISELITWADESGWTESGKLFGLGEIYESAGLIINAEEYYRQALKMEPRNPEFQYYLASLLISNDIDIEEGLELIDLILDKNPDLPDALQDKGWGLYKQGKLEESLNTLKQSWDLLPTYNHDIHLHIQEVEQALASQNQ